VQVGAVRGAIWSNQLSNGDFFSVTFDRTYQDRQTDELKNAHSFGKDDLMELSKAADKAHDRVLELIRDKRKQQAQAQAR
jgi:hypothetical protein